MSEVSKIYAQFADSLRMARQDHVESLQQHAELIRDSYPTILEPHVCSFAGEFDDQVKRLELRNLAESFLGTSEIPFVAIDGSCARDVRSGYLVFYGGAYGSRGTVSLSGAGGTLVYRRWEFNKDVSMVAFVPIPPEGAGPVLDQSEGSDFPSVASDREVAQISSIHTKIMQLAEVYLAYSLAGSSTVDAPKIILLDGSLSGLLGNTSFSPTTLRLYAGDFGGQELTTSDAYIALAHPVSRDLEIPSWKRFQPQNRLVAEATWQETQSLDLTGYTEEQRKHLKLGAQYLARNGVGVLEGDHFTFGCDTRTSWRRSREIADHVCNGLFREKQVAGLTYPRAHDPERREYLTVRDIQFLTGVLLRALVERCWNRKILLLGVVKDSNSRYFVRNFIGTLKTLENGAPGDVHRIHLTDRTVLELLPNIVQDLRAPWGTLEFDSCFMTLRPRVSDEEEWQIGGTPHIRLGETSRPERIFLRSISQFLLKPNRELASHAVFIDRLAYPGWDDIDSQVLTVSTPFFGDVLPLHFQQPSRLQRLSMYLLSVLVRNHFPEALGYPDPLHKADWGAKSMRRRVDALLMSSDWVERTNPRSRTFRQIRDSFGR